MSKNVIYCNLSFYVGSSTKKDNLIHVSTQLGWINSNYRLSRTVDSRTCTTVTIRICPLFFIKDVESIKKRISIKLGINWLNYQSKVKQEVTIIYLIYSNCLPAISLIITSLCSSLIFSKLQGNRFRYQKRKIRILWLCLLRLFSMFPEFKLKWKPNVSRYIRCTTCAKHKVSGENLIKVSLSCKNSNSNAYEPLHFRSNIKPFFITEIIDT